MTSGNHSSVYFLMPLQLILPIKPVSCIPTPDNRTEMARVRQQKCLSKAGVAMSSYYVSVHVSLLCCSVSVYTAFDWADDWSGMLLLVPTRSTEQKYALANCGEED